LDHVEGDAVSKNLIYFVPGLESVAKRKHLLFLQKSGYSIVKLSTLAPLPERVKSLHPVALIINDDIILKDVLPLIGELPVIVLSKANKNISEIMGSVPPTDNIIFFRTESDSLLETVSLCNRIYGGEELEASL
jgi:hypothetical protein